MRRHPEPIGSCAGDVRRLAKRLAPSSAANVLANPVQQVFALGWCGSPHRLEAGGGPAARLHIRVEGTVGWIGVEVEERLVS